MKKNLVKELQRLTKNLANIETNNNNAVGVLHELNDALENESAEAGSNRPLILEFATENPLTVDTPLSEIKAAIEAGRQVWFRMNTAHIALVQYDQFENVLTYLCFCSTTIELDGSVGGYTGVEYYDDEWHLTEI